MLPSLFAVQKLCVKVFQSKNWLKKVNKKRLDQYIIKINTNSTCNDFDSHLAEPTLQGCVLVFSREEGRGGTFAELLEAEKKAVFIQDQ